MKFVVIGGTGLIGSKVVACLREEGEEAVAAVPAVIPPSPLRHLRARGEAGTQRTATVEVFFDLV